MNAVFFQKGSEYGFIGGVGIAIVISFFNIALAFLLGLGPARWIKYRNFALQAFAFITFLVLAIILISLHAFAAHYREAMLAFVPEDQAFTFALDTLTRSPLRLHELSTVYLFGLGILFAILSAWKGYQFDDPYPWYGVTERRREYAREAYSEEHRALFGDLEELKEETVSRLEDGLRDIPQFAETADHTVAALNALVGRFRAYEASVETSVSHLVEIYRDSNKGSRKTSAPRHFSQRYSRPYSFLDDHAVRGLVAPRHDLVSTQTGQILDDLRELSNRVLDEYTKMIHLYPHPTEMQ